MPSKPFCPLPILGFLLLVICVWFGIAGYSHAYHMYECTNPSSFLADINTHKPDAIIVIGDNCPPCHKLIESLKNHKQYLVKEGLVIFVINYKNIPSNMKYLKDNTKSTPTTFYSYSDKKTVGGDPATILKVIEESLCQATKTAPLSK